MGILHIALSTFIAPFTSLNARQLDFNTYKDGNIHKSIDSTTTEALNDVQMYQYIIPSTQLYHAILKVMESSTNTITIQCYELLISLFQRLQMDKLILHSITNAKITRNERDEFYLYHTIEWDTIENMHLYVVLHYQPMDIYFPLYMSSARRSVSFVNNVVSLVTANAMISTLGGGHFMCHHLQQAQMLARLQYIVSKGLQDPILQAKCYLHMVYNYIQKGEFIKAEKLLDKVEKYIKKEQGKDIIESNNERTQELQRMHEAAQVYLEKTVQLLQSNPSLQKKHKKKYDKQPVIDNYYRVRLIQE